MQTEAAWRQERNVLVPDAHALGAIAVIRSLGRAGYRVHACDSDPNALGLLSNFATRRVVCPPYGDPTFRAWTHQYLHEASISLIIPSEGFLHAINPDFEAFCHLMPLSPDRSIVYRAFSKIDVAECLRDAPATVGIAEHLPPTFVARRTDPLPTMDELRRLGTPIYLKSDTKYCSNGDAPLLRRFLDTEQARAGIARALESYEAVLVQGFVPGRKAAAAFCIKDGKVLASSGVTGIRTSPHTGGMMSLRASTRHDALHNNALDWLRFLRWEGVAMVECKWDPATDQYWLIELNTRYWGYLHLDLLSGIDMPRIQADAFFRGAPSTLPPVQRLGVRTRHTVPGDFGYLFSLLRDKEVGVAAKAKGILRFGADFFNPAIHADLLFPGDRKLYWVQWVRFLKQFFG